MIFNLVASGDLPWQTFVGNPIEFDAKKAHMLKSVNVEFEPIQDTSGGNPSPSNICPITGSTGANVTRCGKNLLDVEAFTLVKSSARTKSINFSFLPPGTYSFSVNVTANTSTKATQLVIRDRSGSSYNNIKTLSIPAGETGSFNISFTAVIPFSYLYIYMSSSDTADASITIEDIQLELGSPATAYEAPQVQTVTVDWTTEAGTVYGGTVDVATGLLTVDRAVVDMGTLTWSGSSSTYWGINKTVIGAKQVNNSDLICSAYPTTIDKTSSFSIYDTTNAIRVYDSSYADADAFATAMSGVQLVYKLATPLTYQLTPQQVITIAGRNIMWTDCDSLTVQARGTNV